MINKFLSLKHDAGKYKKLKTAFLGMDIIQN